MPARVLKKRREITWFDSRRPDPETERYRPARLVVPMVDLALRITGWTAGTGSPPDRMGCQPCCPGEVGRGETLRLRVALGHLFCARATLPRSPVFPHQ